VGQSFTNLLAFRNDDLRPWLSGLVFMRRLSAGLALSFGILIGMSLSGTSVAQKLVDPNSVAPEYRDMAEKRRAEQLKLFQCSRKADEAKVLRRDRVAYINECLDK
jgi:hypothetical protein